MAVYELHCAACGGILEGTVVDMGGAPLPEVPHDHIHPDCAFIYNEAGERHAPKPLPDDHVKGLHVHQYRHKSGTPHPRDYGRFHTHESPPPKRQKRVVEAPPEQPLITAEMLAQILSFLPQSEKDRLVRVLSGRQS